MEKGAQTSVSLKKRKAKIEGPQCFPKKERTRERAGQIKYGESLLRGERGREAQARTS